MSHVLMASVRANVSPRYGANGGCSPPMMSAGGNEVLPVKSSSQLHFEAKRSRFVFPAGFSLRPLRLCEKLSWSGLVAGKLRIEAFQHANTPLPDND